MIEIKNKKASYQYYLYGEYTAGIVLTGTEIKSIREGKANLSDAYCNFVGNELFIINLHISEYKFGTHYNHDPKRDRKLLLKSKELKKLRIQVSEKGYTIIPTKLFINENGLAKMLISPAKGKKLYDKRESIKEKDTEKYIKRHNIEQSGT